MTAVLAIDLPLKTASRPLAVDPQVRLARTGSWMDRSRHRYTVLVVDDESDIAESIQDCLERHLPEVRVLTAVTGLEALHHLGAEPIDLIVTDFRMPGMDGFELLQRAKRIAPDARRMVVSAYPLEVTPWLLNLHQLAGVLSKPVDPQALVRAVEEALRGAAR